MTIPLIAKQEKFDFVLLAGGEFPKNELALNFLKNAPRLICCDGAAKNLIKGTNIVPEAIVGDCDSLPQEYVSQYSEIIRRISEQEDNDLTKAMRYIKGIVDKDETFSDKKPRVLILGATGKREDHTLGNVSLLIRYFRDFNVLPIMLTDYGYFVPVRGNAQFYSFAGQQVSVFNVSCKRLSSCGLKWETYPFKELWQGTLNESISNVIKLKADGEYLVYLTLLPK